MYFQLKTKFWQERVYTKFTVVYKCQKILYDAKDYGLERAQGFLGSGDLLNGRMISGACCSATYMYE